MLQSELSHICHCSVSRCGTAWVTLGNFVQSVHHPPVFNFRRPTEPNTSSIAYSSVMATAIDTTIKDSIDVLLESASNIAIEELDNLEGPSACPDTTTPVSRPLIVYTRLQLVRLHESPLVQPPPSMPPLREWYGYVLFSLLICFALADSTLLKVRE
jgi:hypothetical protein